MTVTASAAASRITARRVAPRRNFSEGASKGEKKDSSIPIKGAAPLGETPKAQKENTAFLIGTLVVGGGAYLAYTQGWLDSILGTTPADPEVVASEIAPKVKGAVEDIIDDDDNIAPLLVRLAWHSSGTYAKGGSPKGGSDGARIRFSPEATDDANAGLEKARSILEPVHKDHPGMSYADLYTYAGAVAVEHIGGPHIPFRFGRSDMREAEVQDNNDAVEHGRLPDASKGADHLRDVFYRMGFNDQEIVALSGAHTLGRCHTDRSGYDGPWTFAPTTMSNQFFVLLSKQLSEPGYWRKRKWSGPLQYTDPTGELMMLPTDMVLIEDPKFKPYVLAYAKDEDLFFKDFAAAFSRLLHLGVKSNKLSKTV